MTSQSTEITIEYLPDAIRFGDVTLPIRHFDVDAKPSTPPKTERAGPRGKHKKAMLRVFLCHASENKEDVRELKKRLVEKNVDPWLDEDEILPGQDWERVVEQAMETMDSVIICLSNSFVTKTGYVQKEIRRALSYADLHPPGTIFLVPVRLDDCKVPSHVAHLHYVDLFDDFDKLIASLSKRASNLDLATVG